MRAYLLATLERVAVVGAATATVLKEAMADMMMMCVGRCVRCVPIERDRSVEVESVESVGRSVACILHWCHPSSVGFMSIFFSTDTVPRRARTVLHRAPFA